MFDASLMSTTGPQSIRSNFQSVRPELFSYSSRATESQASFSKAVHGRSPAKQDRYTLPQVVSSRHATVSHVGTALALPNLEFGEWSTNWTI